MALAAFSEGRVVDQLKSAALLTPVAYLAHITTPIGILLAKAFVGEVTYLLAWSDAAIVSFLAAANSALMI